MVSRADSPPPPIRWKPIEVLTVLAGFGMVAGLVEVIAAQVRSHLLNRTIYIGSEMVWQLPLADALIFLVVALLLVSISFAWSRLRDPRVVLAIGCGLVIFAGLLLTEKIHIAAEALLAAGLGAGLARALAPRAERIRKTSRYGVPGAIIALVLMALGQSALRAASERHEIARLPSGTSGRPNILLLVLDTVRAWDLSIYGWGRETTPRLAEWAAKGVLFQRALAPAPWTTLSHASMFTGRYATDLPVSWRTPLGKEFPTLAEVLRDAGYATSGFVGNYLNLGRGTGMATGFVHYEDYPFHLIPWLRSTTIGLRILQEDRIKELVGRRRSNTGLVASDVNRHFLEWLGAAKGRPWFAFLNYFDAHGPYLPPEPFETMYMGKADPPVDRYWANVVRAYGRPPAPPEQLGELVDAYDGAITYLDGQVDALLKALAAQGALENTIVVITSDHGELFSEHGIIGHGNNLYLPVLHVPLLILAPGRAPVNVRIPSVTSLRDLPATLLQLAGVSNPGLPGHSMAGLWDPSSSQTSDTLFAAVDYNWLIPAYPPSPVLRGPMRSIVLDSLQYIRNGDGIEELYHLGRDPWEVQNLVAAPEYQADLLRHQKALATVLLTARPPSPSR